MRFLIKWFINVVALVVVIHIVAGVSADSAQTVIVAALIIGLLNAFLRPFMIIVTLPLTVLTFGLFTLIINAFIFYIAAKFVKGFVVTSFWNAFWASIVFSIISFLFNTLLSPPTNLTFRSYRAEPPEQKRYRDAIDVEAKVEDKKEDQ